MAEDTQVLEATPTPAAGAGGASFDAIAAMINSAAPEVFYVRAAAFDRAAAKLEEIETQFRSVSRQLQNQWSGQSANAYADVSQEITTSMSQVLTAMTSPSWGAQLRQAGDALAGAQQRIRELQAQRTQMAAAATPTAPVAPGADEQFAQLAQQILQGLSSTYQQSGTGMTPLPGGEAAGQGVKPGTATMLSEPGGPNATVVPASATTFGSPQALPGTAVDANGVPVTTNVMTAPDGTVITPAGALVTAQGVVGGPAAAPGAAPGFGGGGFGGAGPGGAALAPAAAVGGANGQPLAPGESAFAPYAGGRFAVSGVVGQSRMMMATAPAEGSMQVMSAAAMPTGAVTEVLGRQPATNRRTAVASPEQGTAVPDTVSKESQDRSDERPSTTSGAPADTAFVAAPQPAFAQASSGVSAAASAASSAAASAASSAGASLPSSSLPSSLSASLSPGGGSAAPHMPDLRSVPGAADAVRLGPVGGGPVGGGPVGGGAPPVRPLATDLTAVTGAPPALSGPSGSAAVGRAPVDPFGGANGTGHPMMPMGGMGGTGMGGQQERETDRQYDIAFEPEDAWGGNDGAPPALGRPERR